MKKQLCINIAVITQLYLQLYITYQLHVSVISDLAIIRLDTIIRSKETLYNTNAFKHTGLKRAFRMNNTIENLLRHKNLIPDKF